MSQSYEELCDIHAAWKFGATVECANLKMENWSALPEYSQEYAKRSILESIVRNNAKHLPNIAVYRIKE